MIKKLISKFLLFQLGVFIFVPITNIGVASAADSGCTGGSFLGFPTWYEYLDKQSVPNDITTDPNDEICELKVDNIKDFWLIALAVIEILLRVASILAVGMLIYGGVSYVISEGNPEKTKKAQSTIINAIVGLAISIVAASVIGFVARSF
ncbi:hypothetical protein KC960_04375 [Candidatus Saccharibacteria bacterium]|nr:hypothetical protein [Candidatus Saccharibacteria bacterium]